MELDLMRVHLLEDLNNLEMVVKAEYGVERNIWKLKQLQTGKIK